MKINYKLIGLVMFVMLICCVSAASATDVDNITVPDDTGIIEIDDTVDSVDEVESEGIDDTVDGVDTQQNLRGTANINGNTNIANYFDSTTGVLLSNAGNTLTFGGDFYKANYNYKNFIVNRAVTINANTANLPILHDMGFELIADGITLNGITMVIDAPTATDCYAIDIENANKYKIKINNEEQNINQYDETNLLELNYKELSKTEEYKYIVINLLKNEIINVSLSVCKIFGYTKEELIGLYLDILFPEIYHSTRK